MNTSDLLKHIYDINLSYLLLAQRLINSNKKTALQQLGTNEEMADSLGKLTLSQMVKLAETNQLICHILPETLQQNLPPADAQLADANRLLPRR